MIFFKLYQDLTSPFSIVIIDRFKDYVPAKYHPLYEQYLKTNDSTLRSYSKELYSYSSTLE